MLRRARNDAISELVLPTCASVIACSSEVTKLCVCLRVLCVFELMFSLLSVWTGCGAFGLACFSTESGALGLDLFYFGETKAGQANKP